jgi:hypothetical protein
MATRPKVVRTYTQPVASMSPPRTLLAVSARFSGAMTPHRTNAAVTANEPPKTT